MTLNYKPYATKFGIRIDANTPFLPSLVGALLVVSLHFTACALIWYLNWPYLVCLLANIFILGCMIVTIYRTIFLVTRYQLSFFFADKEGWMIQENGNPCYRVALCSAFYAKYLVILVFQPIDLAFYPLLRAHCRFPRIKREYWRRLVIPIFFDSLPAHQFRQLRKVLITIQMLN